MPSRWIESVCVDEDQPEPAQQIRILERCQRRIRLGHEERIARRQRGNELRIDGEVVGLDVARPAGPSVALECLVQKELAALGGHSRKIGSPCRGRGIESERRGRVVDETDLTVPESREKRGGARQHEPVHGTLPRPDHERPIRVEAGEGRRPQGHGERSRRRRQHGVGSDLASGGPRSRPASCDQDLTGCRSTTGRTCRQPGAIARPM